MDRQPTNKIFLGEREHLKVRNISWGKGTFESEEKAHIEICGMKLKCIVVRQAAVVFDHGTTFVLFVLYLLSIIISMCESGCVC